MKRNELVLLLKILKEYSDTLGNKGCNDYSLENTKENVKLLNYGEQMNVGEGNKPDIIYQYDSKKETIECMDFSVVYALRCRLEEELDKVK